MDETLSNKINYQINRELYSGYLYLSMAAYLDSKKLKGGSNWMKKQAAEEYFHAMKLYEYLAGKNIRITMEAIEAPQESWESVEAVFEHVLAHEKAVTGMINNLVSVAQGDQETLGMLDWFVHEQVEEEESAEKVLKIVRELPLNEANKKLGER